MIVLEVLLAVGVSGGAVMMPWSSRLAPAGGVAGGHTVPVLVLPGIALLVANGTVPTIALVGGHPS